MPNDVASSSSPSLLLPANRLLFAAKLDGTAKLGAQPHAAQGKERDEQREGGASLGAGAASRTPIRKAALGSKNSLSIPPREGDEKQDLSAEEPFSPRHQRGKLSAPSNRA